MRWLSLSLYLVLCALAGRALVHYQPVSPHVDPARCQFLLEEVVGAGNVRVEVSPRGDSAAILLIDQPATAVPAVERLARGCLGLPGGVSVVNWLPEKRMAIPADSQMMVDFSCER